MWKIERSMEFMMQSHSNHTVEPIVKQFESVVTSAQPSWLLPLRQAGLARFSELGFPTLRDEDWRFTNVEPIARLPFQPARPVSVNGAESAVLSGAPLAGLPGHRLVFVNGFFCAALSSPGKIPGGVRLENLSAAWEQPETRAVLEKHLGKVARTHDNSFAALNQAFFADGALVFIPAGSELPEPVQLIYLAAARQNGETIQPRNLILAGAGSRATVIEIYLNAGGANYFTNAVTEMVAGEGANLEYLKYQDEAAEAFHIATMAGEFGSASRVNVHSFALGARLSRNHIRAKLAGEGLECILNGLYLTRGEQLADHHMIVEHARPHCASHEYFNGILDERSRGVFHGRIYVHPAAQKTDAKQTNKNLLLSDEATVDTKPQLEIYADDVKCTHGATVGQLNDESIFYLRTRGISQNTARRMLIHAFAGEIVERVQCAVAREALDKIVWNRLEPNPPLAER